MISIFISSFNLSTPFLYMFEMGFLQQDEEKHSISLENNNSF